MLLLKNIPIATNENIVTERTTDGAKPAKIPNAHNEIKTITNFMIEPFLVFGSGFSKKVIKSKMNPTCKPDTDKT